MTQPFDDEHGERLRRALHAEAEAVTPSAEGLELIRSKINQRHERRLGFSLSLPWLRPLAAAAAAIVVCVIAVSATPALKNFVQTGHFSPDAGSSGNSATNDENPQSRGVPGGPAIPAPSDSASPTAIRPSGGGKHVVNGTVCPLGENTVSPAGTPVPGAGGPTPQVTCQPAKPTSAPTPAPPAETSAPPVATPTEAPPSDQPTSESAPTADQSP